MPTYIPCEELGDRRFDNVFCLHAENVRISDHDYVLCDGVRGSWSGALWPEFERQLAEGVAAREGWKVEAVENINTEGLFSVVHLDVCSKRPKWAVPLVPRPDGVATTVISDAWPMNVEIVAARGFSYRGPDTPQRLGSLGEWPCNPPDPIDWQDYPECASAPRPLPDGACVRVEGARGRVGYAMELCDGVTLLSSKELTRQVERRIWQRLHVCEHELNRIVEVRLNRGSEFEVTMDVCLDREEGPRSQQRVSIAEGGLLPVQVEHADFTFRYNSSLPYRDGRIRLGEVTTFERTGTDE